MKGIKRIITCGHSLGGALSQMIHIQLHGELETLRDLGLGHENLLNVTFASPMVGNHCLRDNLGDIAGRMYHFVEAGDIVPGALFTHHLYQGGPDSLIFGSTILGFPLIFEIILSKVCPLPNSNKWREVK